MTAVVPSPNRGLDSDLWGAAVAGGARRVRYVDSDPRALAAAVALGAEAVEHHDTWPRWFDMYTRGVTFHVSRADSRRLLPDVVSLVAARRLDPLAIPTTVVPWDQAPAAWLEPATKLVLVRSE